MTTPEAVAGQDWELLDKRHPTRQVRKQTGLILLGSLAFLALAHAIIRKSGVFAFAASLASLWIVFVLSVVLHEVGHVVGAAAVGLRPFILSVGGGPSLVFREVKGVAVDLGLLPGSGLTLTVATRLEPRLKWRLLVLYASGPAASVALLMAALVGFPQEWESFTREVDPWIQPATAAILVNGFLLLTSVVPVPQRSDLGTPKNDLMQILKLPWLESGALEQLVNAEPAVTMSRLLLLRRYQAAFDEGRRQLAERPGAWAVRLTLGEMLLFARRYSEAAREYEALLDEPAVSASGMPPIAAAIIANNHAWANYMLGGSEALAAADSSSVKAYGLAPKNPSILGTRGAVLVARGELEEGRKLLERALRLHRSSHSRASVLAALALAAASEGATENAQKLLERSRRMDPDLELGERIERALGG